MHVWLIDENAPLPPLTERLPKLLLPICGKSMAVLWLEQLCDGKITEVHFVSPQATVLEAHLGHGARWGMRLHYHSPDAVLAEYQATDSNLVLHVDALLDWPVSQVLQQLPSQYARLQLDGHTLGVFVPEGARDKLDLQHWRLPEDAAVLACTGQRVTIDSLKAFYQVNLNILQGSYDWLKPAGRLVSERLYLNNMSTYNEDSLCSGFLYLGEKCRLHKSVVIQSNAVIGDHVIVDREAKIGQAVILPDTYIGRFTEVSNAIVWGNVLVKVDADVVVEVEDDFILGNLTETEQDTSFGGRLRSWLRG